MTTRHSANSNSLSSQPNASGEPLQVLVFRSIFGGLLMGLANLVPGISGGTMLLASGIYPKFIEAIADLTQFRFRAWGIMLLVVVAASAGVAILAGAGLIKELVVNQRWVMYSLFIGLSLGGVPTVWRLARRAGNGDTANRLSPEEPGAVAGPARSGGITLGVSAAGGFGVMFLLALLQWNGVVGSGGSSVSMSIFAGLAGASAMILPGISGAYLLLILGQYVPILGAIDEFKSAIQAGQWQVAWLPAKSTLIPVGIGVVLGIAIVGNLIQYMLRHHLRATAGFLLGLLLGSVITLWPFQEGVQPQPGQIIKGQVIQADAIESIEPEDWPTQYYRPAFLSVVAALGLIAVGFGATCGIARIGLGTNNSTL